VRLCVRFPAACLRFYIAVDWIPASVWLTRTWDDGAWRSASRCRHRLAIVAVDGRQASTPFAASSGQHALRWSSRSVRSADVLGWSGRRRRWWSEHAPVTTIAASQVKSIRFSISPVGLITRFLGRNRSWLRHKPGAKLSLGNVHFHYFNWCIVELSMYALTLVLTFVYGFSPANSLSSVGNYLIRKSIDESRY